MQAKVTAICISPTHTLRKDNQTHIELLTCLGIKGDAHMGVMVKHRSRVKQNPLQPNLRQVHLIHAELHDELREKGFDIAAGQMGENITTQGLDILALPKGTKLHIGDKAIVEITGLRNPCSQLDGIQKGLMHAVLDHDEQGELIRKAGIMGIVLRGGEVRVGNTINVELPPEPYIKLERV